MIKGLSEKRRLPRAGIIRLGVKKKHAQSGKEYPVETDFFVSPDPVKEVYGDEPKELLIMFPIENEEDFFSQFYKRYGHGILLCRGDGEKAREWNFETGWYKDKECPCEALETGDCKAVGVLQFLLPEVKGAVAVWQISTGSKNSIIDVNSGIALVRGLIGRIAMIPLWLRRVPMETTRIDGKKIKKGKHYTLQLSLAVSLMEAQRKALIPPTRALLPEPDETPEAVDDLTPPNGHATEEQKAEMGEEVETVDAIIEEETDAKEEKEVIEKIVEKDINESELTELKKELSAIMEDIKKAGRTLTDAEAVKLDALQTAEGYRNKITYWKRELEKSKATTDLFKREE